MMKTVILFLLAAVLSCCQTNTSAEVLKHIKTPQESNPNESFMKTKNSASTLLTDNINEIIQRKNFFDDLWGSIKGPLEQIGKQAVLNLGTLAANAIQQAAASAVGKREDVDLTWQELKTHVQTAALDLWNVVKTALADVKDVLQQTAGDDFDKRNIFDDFYQRIKDPLKQAGKQALQSLVGVLLQAFQQQGSLVGKRNIFDDIWERFKEPLKAAGQQALQIILGAATDALNNQATNAVGKRNIIDDIWNKVKVPLTLIGKQMTQALAGMAAGALQQPFITGVGRRSIWKHIWHSIKRPLQATGKQMGHILSIVAAKALTNAVVALGKRGILTDTWETLKGPLETSVTDIAEAIVAEVKNSLPKAAKTDLTNIKDRIIAELLSVGEQYYNRTLQWLGELTDEDHRRTTSAGHKRTSDFLQHIAKMYDTSLTTENLPALAKLVISDAVGNAQRVIPQLMINKLQSIMHILSKIMTSTQT